MNTASAGSRNIGFSEFCCFPGNDSQFSNSRYIAAHEGQDFSMSPCQFLKPSTFSERRRTGWDLEIPTDFLFVSCTPFAGMIRRLYPGGCACYHREKAGNLMREFNSDLQRDGFLGTLYQPGPTLPAFLSPNVVDFLVKNFGIAPIPTPEADLKEILG